jgi:hypothetical protein
MVILMGELLGVMVRPAVVTSSWRSGWWRLHLTPGPPVDTSSLRRRGGEPQADTCLAKGRSTFVQASVTACLRSAFS